MWVRQGRAESVHFESTRVGAFRKQAIIFKRVNYVLACNYVQCVSNPNPNLNPNPNPKVHALEHMKALFLFL